MIINVNTIYGDVTLNPVFDPSIGTFYSLYDESENYLGDLQYTDIGEEPDDYALDVLSDIIEDAIETGSIRIPNIKQENDAHVHVITVCELHGKKPVAYSRLFKTKSDAMEFKQTTVANFLEEEHERGNHTNVIDSDEICEITGTNYMCLTYKIVSL